MKKIAFLAIIFLSSISISYAGSISLPSSSITAAPLATVENNGTGIGEFCFVETSSVSIQPTYIGSPNVTINVSLQLIELSGGDVSLITGTLLDFFTVFYDEVNNLLIFEQSDEIPGDGYGCVQFPITVTENSLITNPLNGFNTDMNAIDPKVNAVGNTTVYTYTFATES